IITKDIAVLQSDIDKYSEIVQKNTELKANNANMENFINRIEGVDENTAHTSEIIEKLNSYVPKEITFNAMSFSDSGNISISGEATTYYSIPEFLANLQMSELFSNAKISYITPIERFLSSSNTRNVSEANESNITDDDISIANAEKEARNIVSGTVAANYGKGTSSEEQISSGSSTSNEQSITSSNNNGNSNAISTVNSNIIT
ncbi:PilN domain-containing protein, partial [Clostridium saudiense]|nr:PilN domain-containing protein [Clostridium saudiense]